jgi:hypothetical protein
MPFNKTEFKKLTMIGLLLLLLLLLLVVVVIVVVLAATAVVVVVVMYCVQIHKYLYICG